MKILCLVLFEIFCVSSLHAQLSTGQLVPHRNTKRSVAEDEGPILQASECYMLEETLIDVNNSRCIFEISSTEGDLDTISFTIIGTSGENDIFDLQYQELPEISDTMGYIYLVLKDNQTLNYETKKTFTFDVEVEGASDKVSITVNVYKPPIWTTFPSILEIEEEQNTTFTISAKAGDGHPDSDILILLINSTYEVFVNDYSKNTMDIFVPAIDREVKNSFVLNLIASYLDKPYDGYTYGLITVLVTDIDDNPPKIEYINDDYHGLPEFIVPQNATSVIVSNIRITDRDEGLNSEFSVAVKAPDSDQSAIEISPSTGFKKATFEIIIDPSKLVYDDSMSSNFTLEVHATGVNNDAFSDSLPMTINLRKIGHSGGSGSVGAVWTVVFSVLMQCLRYF